MEHRRYVVAAPSASNQTSGGILNRLQPAHQSIRDAEEQRITAIQAAGDERLTGIFRQRPDSRLQLPQLVVAASTGRSDVSRQRQLAVNDDAEVKPSRAVSWTRRHDDRTRTLVMLSLASC